MNAYEITITDRNTNQVVEVVKNARIPDRMRINRQYKTWEGMERYCINETKQSFDALGYPK